MAQLRIVGCSGMSIQRQLPRRPKGHKVVDQWVAARIDIPCSGGAHDSERDGKSDAQPRRNDNKYLFGR
jgi:hypothetical protein